MTRLERGVMRPLQGRHVRRTVRASGFEEQHIGRRPADIATWIARHGAHDFCVLRAYTTDRVKRQRFERRTAVAQREVGRDHGVECEQRRRRLPTLNRGDELIPLPHVSFDMGPTIRLGTERLAQSMYGLDDAVVGDGQVSPGRVRQLTLGEDLPTSRNYAFSGVVNGKIYVIGGRIGSGFIGGRMGAGPLT